MKYVVSLDDMQRCVKYGAAAAKRSACIRAAHKMLYDDLKKRELRDIGYKAIMDMHDAGVSCGVFAMSSRIYCKKEV